jgi:predicted SAM-dependent methyltransferase
MFHNALSYVRRFVRYYRRGFKSQKVLLLNSNKLNLGCGWNAIEGWINIDFDGPPSVFSHDLTKPLPLAKGSIDFIFSEHFIEHIRREEAVSLLQECHRVLRPNGIVRISTPDLESIMNQYTANDPKRWQHDDFVPDTKCQMLNRAVRDWGHQFIYDFDELKLLFEEAGFNYIKRVKRHESDHAELECLETRPPLEDLIVEAVRLDAK